METKDCKACHGKMSAADTHKNCNSCRSINRNCIECNREFKGTRRKCDSCNSIKQNQVARDRRYGFTLGEYDAMYILQEGKCSICANTEASISKTGRSYSLVVDHDHKCCPGEKTCGKCVRGLICRKCNILLGMAGDDITVLRNALNYILAFSSEREDQPSESLGMAQVDEKNPSSHADRLTSSHPDKD